MGLYLTDLTLLRAGFMSMSILDPRNRFSMMPDCPSRRGQAPKPPPCTHSWHPGIDRRTNKKSQGEHRDATSTPMDGAVVVVSFQPGTRGLDGEHVPGRDRGQPRRIRFAYDHFLDLRDHRHHRVWCHVVVNHCSQTLHRSGRDRKSVV